MAADFKYVVVGRGMMGSAAARHLTLEVDSVAVIGPDEPADRTSHEGVFASHYDEARITRTFDDNRVWSELASRSIDRYGDLEAASGIRFFTEAGCLFSAPPQAPGTYMARALDVCAARGLSVETIPAARLTERFPHMRFPAVHSGYFEARRAGHVNPRALVRAQSVMAQRQGAQMIAETAVRLDDRGDMVAVTTAEGRTVTADRVLVAAGGFTNPCGLLPLPVDMRATARTIVFFELDEARLSLFRAMPSTVVFAERDEDLVYILPPVRYPDGKTYLKIGGDSERQSFSDLSGIGAWFRSDGDRREAEHLTGIALSLMPGLEGTPVTSGSCIASFTSSSYPFVGFTPSPRIAVMTGGNFVAAKCSDEIGRLGARLMIDGHLSDGDFGRELKPQFVRD